MWRLANNHIISFFILVLQFQRHFELFLQSLFESLQRDSAFQIAQHAHIFLVVALAQNFGHGGLPRWSVRGVPAVQLLFVSCFYKSLTTVGGQLLPGDMLCLPKSASGGRNRFRVVSFITTKRELNRMLQSGGSLLGHTNKTKTCPLSSLSLLSPLFLPHFLSPASSVLEQQTNLLFPVLPNLFLRDSFFGSGCLSGFVLVSWDHDFVYQLSKEFIDILARLGWGFDKPTVHFLR